MNRDGFRGLNDPAGAKSPYVNQKGPQPNGSAQVTARPYDGVPYIDDRDFTLYVGDVRDVLQTMPDESVHCVVTSPPYWGLRDYGTGAWDGGDADCDHRVNNPDGGTRPNGSPRSGEAYAQGKRSPFRDQCGKCGARRVDKQLGLEPTPDEYITSMVAVFREVRRVLRRDGTCWLNIGDSYGAANNRNGSDGVLDRGTKAPVRDANRLAHGPSYRKIPGVKPKDLVGIPWRLAFALQQPYYTGRIKDERDRIWLAAMVEAEGCMFLHKRKAGQSNGQGYERKNDSYGAGLEVASTDRVVVERCMAIAGIGSICEQGPNENHRRKQTIYRWNIRSNECRTIIRELYPHMIAKQHEARLLIGCPSSGPKAIAAWQSLKDVHQGGEATIDFPPPETLFEPGWYVRSDIVWSKCNPMPESVTDRPTKAHEYVFLLTRSPRYFFDQEAVREPAEWAMWGAQTVPKYNGTKSQTGWMEPKTLAEREAMRAGGRNVRSVWEIATQPYAQAHFATFPEALVERCVKAGTSERGCCPECGAPWERAVEETPEYTAWKQRESGWAKRSGDLDQGRGTAGSGTNSATVPTKNQTTGWKASCSCDGSYFSALNPCTVLDPFMGSGTTALVARNLGRKSIGIELNQGYARLAATRLQQLSLLA